MVHSARFESRVQESFRPSYVDSASAPPSLSMICSTISGDTTSKELPPHTAQTTGAASAAETPHFRQIEMGFSFECSSTTLSARRVAALAPFGM